jgi:simple sugar transport system permease protein
MLKAIPQLGIMSLGVNLLMISGEFDLSVGSNFTLTSIIMAKIFNQGIPAIFAVLLALVVGCFVGWSNGIITTKAKIPSFIVTLGTMMFWRGMILLTSGGLTEKYLPGVSIERILTGSIGIFQSQFIWFLFLTIVTWAILERHKLGNQFFAVGGNKEAAIAIGVNPNKIKIIAFMITGILASFSGTLSTTRIRSVSPIQGEGLELQAIAACVIGGTSLTGGEGSVIGVFLGATLIYTIQDILLLLRAPGFYLQMFIGIVVVAAAILNRLFKVE